MRARKNPNSRLKNTTPSSFVPAAASMMFDGTMLSSVSKHAGRCARLRPSGSTVAAFASSASRWPRGLAVDDAGIDEVD